MDEYELFVWQYLKFKQAQELGIVFGVNDLTPQEIEIFHTLKEAGIGLKKKDQG